MEQALSFQKMVVASRLLHGILGTIVLHCFAFAAHAAADGTCDAVSGKCAGVEYATDPPCYFPTSLLEVKVEAIRSETWNSLIVTFELPPDRALNVPVSSAILANAPGYDPDDGSDVLRPYNPISDYSLLGSFDLLVKVYPEGVVSKYLGSLKVGDSVAFKQTKAQVKKWRYPFGKASITMVAGGTGIAPMMQALHPLLKTPGDTTHVTLLYGNNSPKDIMLKRELDQMVAEHSERFQVIYVVGRSADDRSAAEDHGWAGEMGWIDEDKLRRLAFPPSEDTVVWVCGTDAMYVSLAGSRGAPLKKGSALSNLGYTRDMVWRS